MAEVSQWNEWVVDEFRANRGKVGQQYDGFLMILVHHTGARSGTARINPLVYQPVGDDFAIFASKRGATRHPDWYHNLKAHPRARVEIGTEAGTETVEVRAREAEGAERERLWEAQKTAMPVFREYEAVAARVIPVLLLERV